MTLRHASFFSGVGGLDLGFERAGIETVSFSEIDPYASAVLATHWPNVPNLGNIIEVKEEDIPNAEIYSGGFPCQDLSVAGKRAGFAGSRSSLAFRFLDLVERRNPRWVVLENVPGLFSSNGGRDFGRLLGEMVQLGYGLAWRILNARDFGIPHARRRVFIVAARDQAFGDFGADRAAEVLFNCEGSCGHIKEGGQIPTGDSNGSLQRVGKKRRDYGNSPPNSDGMRTVIQLAGRLDDREKLEEKKDLLSFPSRFGMNAKFTEEIAQSFAHSAGAPAVFQSNGSFLISEKGANSLDEIGLDGHRYRCAGNGIVSNVAEWVGRRIIAVDKKYTKEAL